MCDRKKIYIAGKISGLTPQEAEAKFAAVEKRLEAEGFKVQNPWKLIGGVNQIRRLEGKEILTDSHHRKEIMKICLRAMLKCDVVYMQPCWYDSLGANKENEVAKGLIPIYYNLDILITDLKIPHYAPISHD